MIGSDLTGEISRLVMSLWDIKFLDKLKRTGICVDTYKQYVDNQVEVLPPISPGWNLIPRKG